MARSDLLIVLTALALVDGAREITFPVVSPVHDGSHQAPLGWRSSLGADIRNAKFEGLSTFANLPYVHCLKQGSLTDEERFDIGILGAGFDTVRSQLILSDVSGVSSSCEAPLYSGFPLFRQKTSRQAGFALN